MTAAPRESNSDAQARPMPDAAPVTSATRPAIDGGGPARPTSACSRSQYSTSKTSARGERGVTPEVILGPLQHLDGVEIDVGRDLRRRRSPSDGEQAQLRIEHDTRRRVERGQVTSGAVALELAAVCGGVRLDVAAYHREPLCPDHVVGRQRTPRGERRAGRAERRTGAPSDPVWRRTTIGTAGCVAEPAPESSDLHGVDVGKRRPGVGRHRCLLLEPLLGSGDHLGMAGVRLLGGLSPREQPMVEQHHPDAVPGLSVGPHSDDRLGKQEPGHDVRNDEEIRPEDLGNAVGTVGEVRQRDDDVGVAVLDRGGGDMGV